MFGRVEQRFILILSLKSVRKRDFALRQHVTNITAFRARAAGYTATAVFFYPQNVASFVAVGCDTNNPKPVSLRAPDTRSLQKLWSVPASFHAVVFLNVILNLKWCTLDYGILNFINTPANHFLTGHLKIPAERNELMVVTHYSFPAHSVWNYLFNRENLVVNLQ